MSAPKIRTILIQKGKKPFCLKSGRQCRGCFGWRNMIKAAHTDKRWQAYPIKCPLSGLALQVKTTKKL